MIKVCDAIMGSGKSESAISYIKEHPDQKFIYVTPYLPEATRIRLSCLPIEIVEPEEKYYYKEDREDDEYWRAFEVAKRTKVMHTAKLISEGKNVATTHQAFMYYTPEMLRNIRDQHYTLIIDEDMQVISLFKAHPEDLDIAVSGGIVKEDRDVFTLGDTEYRCGVYYGMVRLLKSRVLEKVSVNAIDATMTFWVLPDEFLRAFDDIFILTYMFEGQALYNLLKMSNMAFEYIGIRHDDTGYHFDPNGVYMPEYAKHLIEKIHIVQDPKLNNIGNKRTALSLSWMQSHPDEMQELACHIYNFFHNKTPGDGKHRIWTTYKKMKPKLTRAGYTRRFVVLNQKSTNEFADCNCLAYVANIFLNPGYKTYYSRHGLSINEDLYALSTMVQWIFRSAIRKGEEIWVYVPSRRMRTLLENWLAELAKGGEADERHQREVQAVLVG